MSGSMNRSVSFSSRKNGVSRSLEVAVVTGIDQFMFAGSEVLVVGVGWVRHLLTDCCWCRILDFLWVLVCAGEHVFMYGCFTFFLRYCLRAHCTGDFELELLSSFAF